MLKDLCLGCGAEHFVVRPINRSKTPCCENRRMVHQVECSGCKKVVLGYVVDDDYHGLDAAYCGECMSAARPGRVATDMPPLTPEFGFAWCTRCNVYIPKTQLKSLLSEHRKVCPHCCQQGTLTNGPSSRG